MLPALLRRGGGAAAGSSAARAWRGGHSAARFFAAPSVQLYQYEICPFCCKVKAFLDWQKVPYTTTEVNPISKAEIKFSEKYRKVPIAMINDAQVNESMDIIAKVAAELEGSSESTPLKDSLADPETTKWLQWADKELAVLLFPNITRNFGESFQAFRYISEVPTFGAGSKVINQAVGSVAMWLANGKLKKKYNITDERKQLLDTLNTWTDAVGEGPFLKGEQLSVPDVVVYGVISAIRGLDAHAEVMKASPKLAEWCERVRAALGASHRIEEPKVPRSFGPLAP